MKKLIPIISGLLLLVGIGAFVILKVQKSATPSSQVIKPQNILKKVSQEEYSEDGARRLVQRYWELHEEENFEKMYDLLSPNDRTLVSRETFIRKNREDVRENQMPIPKWEITAIELRPETKEAVATITVDSILGKVKEFDTVIYVDGKWYQKLETDSYSFYGVSLSENPNIKKFRVGEIVVMPGLELKVVAIKESNLYEAGYERKTPKGKFVLVTAEIKNTGKQTYKGFMTRFKLIDDKDREYNDEGLYESLTGPKEIAAGFSETGDIIFDIPLDSKASKLLIQTESGGQLYLVDLSVIQH